jgi:hypothetical protein
MKTNRDYENYGGRGAWPERRVALYRVLNAMCDVIGYTGETGTEALFLDLEKAVKAVRKGWRGTVARSHRIGLAYDVNALLAGALEEVLSRTDVEQEAE